MSWDRAPLFFTVAIKWHACTVRCKQNFSKQFFSINGFILLDSKRKQLSKDQDEAFDQYKLHRSGYLKSATLYAAFFSSIHKL